MSDDPNEGKPQNKFLSGLGGALKKVGDKAKETDQNLHLSEKTKQATDTVVQKTKELDEKHQISEKTKKAVGVVNEKTKEAFSKLKKDRKDDGEGGAEKKWKCGHDWRLTTDDGILPNATWLHFTMKLEHFCRVVVLLDALPSCCIVL